MPNINKVFVNAETHPFKDDVSGYGIFSAQQTMPSTTTGATLIASVGYRSFSTTTQTFGATQSVNFYSTGGNMSGNDWTATVDGTNLILDSGTVPIHTIIGIMPSLSGVTNVSGVVAALEEARLITVSGSYKTRTYTSNGPFDIIINYYTNLDVSTSLTITPEGITMVVPTSATRAFSSQPVSGTSIEANRTDSITITQNPPGGGGGGVTTLVEPDYPSVTGEASI